MSSKGGRGLETRPQVSRKAILLLVIALLTLFGSMLYSVWFSWFGEGPKPRLVFWSDMIVWTGVALLVFFFFFWPLFTTIKLLIRKWICGSGIEL